MTYVEQVLVASVHSLLALSFLAILLITRRSSSSSSSCPSSSASSCSSLLLAFLVASSGLARLSLSLWLLSLSRWSLSPSFLSSLAQALSWLLLSSSLLLLLPSSSLLLSSFVRIWCLVVSLLGTYDATLSLIHLVNGDPLSANIALVLATWPICCALFISALRELFICAFRRPRSTSASAADSASTPLSEPLLNNDSSDSPHSSSCRKASPTYGRYTTLTPFATAGLFSRITFWWLSPLFSLGSKKPLEQSDLPGLAPSDQPGTAYDAFQVAWHQQKMACSSKDSSVLWALISCSWKSLLKTGIYALLKTLALSATPLVLNFFIKLASGVQLFELEGYVLVAALFLGKTVESVSQRQWYFESKRAGMNFRSALMAAIYQKQLRLSNAGRQTYAAGEIVNYMSVDAYRIGDFPYWIHQAWAIPLQFLLAMALFIYSVGWATLAAVFATLLAVLANTPAAKLQQKFHTQLMSSQDQRLRTTTEALQNMKILKLQAWEDYFKGAVQDLRQVEYGRLSAVQYQKAFNIVLFWITPTVITTATFTACYFLGISLTASNVFTCFATLRILQEPIQLLPDMLAALIQARVSFARLARFFAEDELQTDAVEWNSNGKSDFAVAIKSASLSWDPSTSKPTLRNIGMQVKHGQRVAVCGEVGAGKSTLLNSILGEVPKLSGSLKVYGSIAYVAQTAWIQSGTIRDNVLFGHPMDRKRYDEILRACALHTDLEILPFGDLTEIGERGINLSGGQKQRIQLARAVYWNADIYLLDDPFSAVDAHTATSIFKHCIMETLCQKTVILVTHQVEFLPAFDSILLMQDGEIQQVGRYEELLQAGTAFEELVNAHKVAMASKAMDNHIDHDSRASERIRQNSFTMLQKQLSRAKSREEAMQMMETSASQQLTKEEEKETGGAVFKAYIDYLSQNKGFYHAFWMMLCQVIFTLFQVGSNVWIAKKVDDSQTGTATLVIVYSALGFASVVFLLGRSVLVVRMGLAASRSYFRTLNNSLFRASMAFFDSTPTGRILSRVSSDLSLLDVDLPLYLATSIANFIIIFAYLLVISVAIWPALFLIIVMLYLTWRLQARYSTTAKELMRLNGTTKSPIASYFSETIAGVTTIRAFRVQFDFLQRSLHLIANNASPYFHTFAANEWIIQRLEALCTVVVCCLALAITLFPAGTFHAGFVGLALTYGLSVNSIWAMGTQNLCTLSSTAISVERIKQYLSIPSEAPTVIENSRPSPSWPLRGKVELLNLQVRYRANSPLVLRGITCTFEEGQKVGVVGRTGSGKTTLISALFRLVEPVGGSILIDGLDISTIGLHDLRSRLSIIPQEPTLFRGTVRTNLDPLSLYSDSKIWEVLDKCQLGSIIREKQGMLDSPVGEDGANWSVGQRQLFCLGRVLLKHSRVLVLDEATSSIDNTTDSILQNVIREEFVDSTVITVAHRIPTVVDSDMVLAINDGILVEFDRPNRLLEKKMSLFAKLVAEYWARANGAINTGSLQNS